MPAEITIAPRSGPVSAPPATTPSTRSWRARALRWLRLPVSVGLVAYLLFNMDLSLLPKIAGAARLELLLIVFLVMPFADRILVAIRLYVLMRGVNPDIKLGRVVHIVFVSSALGYLTPGGVGAEILRVYGLSKATSNLALSFSSVLIERTQALITLMLLVIIALIAAPPGLPDFLGQIAWVGLISLIAGSVAVMSPTAREFLLTLLPGRWLAPLRRPLVKLFDSLDAYRQQPARLLITMALTVLYQLTRITQIVLASWALGLDIALIHFLVIMPLIFFAILLPISFGGIGVREAGFVYLFGFVGVLPEAAFMLAIIEITSRLSAISCGVVLYTIGGVSGKPAKSTSSG